MRTPAISTAPRRWGNFTFRRYPKNPVPGRVSAIGLLAARIFHLCLGVAALTGPLHGFDTPKIPWPRLRTSHGQPLNVAGSIQEAIHGSIDFLITGIPISDDELRQAYQARSVNLIHIATAVTAAVPCYNLSGIDAGMKFSADVLAGIFLGRIRRWNDPAIASLNPTIKLPGSEIVVVGHAAEDGSTYALSDFLSRTNRKWRDTVGNARGLPQLVVMARGENDDDVADLVGRTPNSISYVELWAAKNHSLRIGQVRNRSGHFVEASTESISAAAASALPAMLDDIRASLTDARGLADYPISVLTWIVVPATAPDSESRSLVLSFLKWILTEGQASAESAFYGRLPPPLIAHELQVVESLRAKRE